MTKRIEARTKSQKLAAALAVAYNAYNEADRAVPSVWSETDEDKLAAIRVWGRALLSAQKAVGFEMYRTVLIEDHVARAQERSERLSREKDARAA
jgi:hypothetical protein